MGQSVKLSQVGVRGGGPDAPAETEMKLFRTYGSLPGTCHFCAFFSLPTVGGVMGAVD